MLDTKEREAYELYKAEKAMIDYNQDSLAKVKAQKEKVQGDKEKEKNNNGNSKEKKQ